MSCSWEQESRPCLYLINESRMLDVRWAFDTFLLILYPVSSWEWACLITPLDTFCPLLDTPTAPSPRLIFSFIRLLG